MGSKNFTTMKDARENRKKIEEARAKKLEKGSEEARAKKLGKGSEETNTKNPKVTK